MPALKPLTLSFSTKTQVSIDSKAKEAPRNLTSVELLSFINQIKIATYSAGGQYVGSRLSKTKNQPRRDISVRIPADMVDRFKTLMHSAKDDALIHNNRPVVARWPQLLEIK